jgi:hypothetical protein
MCVLESDVTLHIFAIEIFRSNKQTAGKNLEAARVGSYISHKTIGEFAVSNNKNTSTLESLGIDPLVARVCPAVPLAADKEL